MIRRKTTQEILGESIHELAQKKPVDKITIKEIVENCGLSSATFYRYFQDKHELVAWVYNKQIESIFEDLNEEVTTWKQALHDAISIMGNDRLFYLNAFMHTEGPTSFFQLTHSRCSDLLRDLVEKRYGAELPEEMVFNLAFYMRGGSYTVLEWFVNGKMNYTVEQLADYIYQAMPEKLKPYLA